MTDSGGQAWRTGAVRVMKALAFVAAYVLLDWASDLHPFYGLNITLWNPAPAMGLVLWARRGKAMALPWFTAILISEIALRELPAHPASAVLFALALTAGYGVMGEALRRHLEQHGFFTDRRSLFAWLIVVLGGTLANSILFISLLQATGELPAGNWGEAWVRFWVGDCVGIIVTMPFFWLLLNEHGQERFRAVLRRTETAGYAALAVAMLWLTFSSGGHAEFQYFYFLFLPVVWAAARQGLAGAAVAAFLLQAGIVVAVEAQQLVAVTALELQMLGAVLALAGFFIGVVVDEQRRAAERLQQSLHLAAAGQMAAALAHELNQPLTALAAYGSACELLLDKGDSGERLADTIRRMVAESGRAADVVRRLRDFFRTGATKLEPVEVDALVAATAAPFRDRARDMQVQLVVSPASGATLLADRLQIEVALRNLIGNAFDAVARCTGERRVSVSATTDRRGRVSLVVEDTGPGISASAQTRLFEPFASTKSSGLGLGLVISRAVIEAHGGRLWAEAADHGIFKISLPLRETTHAAA